MRYEVYPGRCTYGGIPRVYRLPTYPGGICPYPTLPGGIYPYPTLPGGIYPSHATRVVYTRPMLHGWYMSRTDLNGWYMSRTDLNGWSIPRLHGWSIPRLHGWSIPGLITGWRIPGLITGWRIPGFSSFYAQNRHIYAQNCSKPSHLCSKTVKSMGYTLGYCPCGIHRSPPVLILKVVNSGYTPPCDQPGYGPPV